MWNIVASPSCTAYHCGTFTGAWIFKNKIIIHSCKVMLARYIELQVIIQKISSVKSGKIIAVLHPYQTSESKFLINITYKGDH